MAGQEAHHLIPIQLLKENAIVKKAVEAGFDFNGITNGMALDKYSKATGLGKHGPHPNYTKQIGNHLNWWGEQVVNGVKNKNLSPQLTKQYLEGLSNSLKNKINATTGRINLLDLNLPH